MVPARIASTCSATSARRADIDQVDLADRHHAVVDAQAIQEREVLQGLGPRPVIGGDHQERAIDLACPDEHVADETVVARDVHEVELEPSARRR